VPDEGERGELFSERRTRPVVRRGAGVADSYRNDARRHEAAS
jgi:hypothetical protein